MPDLESYLGALVLAAARSLPLCLIPPLPGPTVSPPCALPLRLAAAVVLAGLCLALVCAQVSNEPGIRTWTAMALLAGREACVGVAMGFVCSCWFHAAAMGGAMLDEVSAGSVVLARRGGLAALTRVFASVTFLEVGGLRQVAAGLAKSYHAIPLSLRGGSGMSLRMPVGAAAVASAQLFAAGLVLCAPLLATLLLVELVFAMVEGAPQHDDPYRAVKIASGMAALLLGLSGLGATLRATLVQFLALMLSALRMGG